MDSHLFPIEGSRLNHQDHAAVQQEFQRDGFIVLRQFVAGAALEALLENINRFVRDVAPTMAPEEVFYEDRADRTSLKQMQNMGQHDPYFGEMLNSGDFPDLATRLLGGPSVPRNLQYFSKPPGVGRPTPPHQDGYYFMLDPCLAVTMWLALDDIDEENGCVRYVRGSHQRGIREHARTNTLGFSQGIIDFPTETDTSEEVAIPAQPGDLIVHHAMTIHSAGGNQSASRPRRAQGLVYYGEAAKVDTEAHAAYQVKLREEMKGAGRI